MLGVLAKVVPFKSDDRQLGGPEPHLPARLHRGERLDHIHRNAVAQLLGGVLEIRVAQCRPAIAGGLHHQLPVTPLGLDHRTHAVQVHIDRGLYRIDVVIAENVEKRRNARIGKSPHRYLQRLFDQTVERPPGGVDHAIGMGVLEMAKLILADALHQLAVALAVFQQGKPHLGNDQIE